MQSSDYFILSLYEIPDDRTEEEKAFGEALHDTLYYCIDRIDSMTMDEKMEYRGRVEKHDILREKYELNKKIKKELLEEGKASNSEKKNKSPS